MTTQKKSSRAKGATKKSTSKAKVEIKVEPVALDHRDKTADTMRKILQIERPAKTNLDFQWLSLHLKKYNVSDEGDDNEKLN